MSKLKKVAKKTKFPVDFKITPGMHQVSELEYGYSHILDYFIPMIRDYYVFGRGRHVTDDRWDSMVLAWVKRCSPKSREPQFYNIKQWEAAIEYSKKIRNNEESKVPLPNFKTIGGVRIKGALKLSFPIKSECSGRPWQDDLIDEAMKK